MDFWADVAATADAVDLDIAALFDGLVGEFAAITDRIAASHLDIDID